MKAVALSLLFALQFTQAVSQNLKFTLADPQPDIFEVYSGTAALGDLDGDGDVDLVQSGLGENLTGQSARASVFLNDGDGNFTLLDQNFNDFFSTERTVIGDLDNDDDLDLIISSLNRTDFYRNDAQANFTHEPSAPFEPSDAGECIIGDVDGDGDNDVIQYGSNSQANPFSKLFLNDGTGGFTEVANTPFSPYINAQIAFIDLDDDNDMDLLSFGEKDNSEAGMSIYRNDGSGIFSLATDSNVEPHFAEEISVGDIDNDGDQDFLISGKSNTSEPSTLLYLNNGNGQFSLLNNTSFPDIFASSNAFEDLDNDNDLDVLLIGSMAGGLPNIFSIVFENLGNNTFVASDSLGGEYIPANGIADLNGDDKKDILIQGFVDDTNVYWNNTDLSVGLDNALNIDVNIFPNPSTGAFQIETDNNSVFHFIEIFDMHGRSVYSEPILEQNQQKTFHLEMSPGSYWIRLTGKQMTVQRSFILIK